MVVVDRRPAPPPAAAQPAMRAVRPRLFSAPWRPSARARDFVQRVTRNGRSLAIKREALARATIARMQGGSSSGRGRGQSRHGRSFARPIAITSGATSSTRSSDQLAADRAAAQSVSFLSPPSDERPRPGALVLHDSASSSAPPQSVVGRAPADHEASPRGMELRSSSDSPLECVSVVSSTSDHSPRLPSSSQISSRAAPQFAQLSYTAVSTGINTDHLHIGQYNMPPLAILKLPIFSPPLYWLLGIIINILLRIKCIFPRN